jgi:hypothetical protein
MDEVEKLIEKILNHFAGREFAEELDKAKKEFFDHAVMDQDRNDHYELRMNQFFDWYFFSRKLSNFGQTPLEACLLVRDLRFDENELLILATLKKNVHSLFEFNKIKGKDVYLKDVIKNIKITAKNSNVLFGFNEEEIFEARLVQLNGQWQFLKGFCFHPVSVKKIILTEVKKFRKNTDLDSESFIFRLMKMRYKFEQYKHVKPEMIYSQEVLA